MGRGAGAGFRGDKLPRLPCYPWEARAQNPDCKKSDDGERSPTDANSLKPNPLWRSRSWLRGQFAVLDTHPLPRWASGLARLAVGPPALRHPLPGLSNLPLSRDPTGSNGRERPSGRLGGVEGQPAAAAGCCPSPARIRRAAYAAFQPLDSHGVAGLRGSRQLLRRRYADSGRRTQPYIFRII